MWVIRQIVAWTVIVATAAHCVAQEKIAPTRRAEIEATFRASLARANPDYQGKADITVNDAGAIVGLSLPDASSISDLSFLKGLLLERLRIDGCGHIADLSPLSDLPLQSVALSDLQAADLAVLAGKPLISVHITSKTLTDISALRGMPLVSAGFFCPRLADLSPLQDMPLRDIGLYTCRSVTDISPLRNAKLRHINFEGTSIKDLSPLKGQPIEEARICCPVLDLSPLAGMPLKHVDVGGGTGNDRNLNDISPLRGMTEMRDLRFDQTSVSDISVVRDMKSLKLLAMFDTQVKDLSPVKDLELETLLFTPRNFPPEQIQILRQMKSLRSIDVNWRSWPKLQSAETFWKRYDAGEYR